MTSASQNPNVTINTAEACHKLAAALPGEVFHPGSSEYNSSVESYFFRTARQNPACIVRPTSAEHVAEAVKILADHPDVKFAIRSGGHTPNPNHSNVEAGITIDLRSLNAIQDVEGEENILRVGPGAEWGAVYEHLEKVGRSAVGSRESSVAIGGFITGGGLSFFSPELGFACDNVVNFEVVLPGKIVNANVDENTDLFRAIRGGQGNFGIVTRFDILTHERKTYWGGGILYPESTEDAQFQAWVDLKSGEYDPHAAVVQSFLYFGAQKSFVVSNNMVYLRDVEHPAGLKGFEDIQPQIQGTMRLDTTKNFALELQAWQPLNQYAVYVTTTIKLTPTIGKKINSVWRAATLEIADSPNITSVLTYQQFPPQHQDNPNGLGLDASADLHKQLLVLIVSIYWHEHTDSERITKVAKGAMEKIEAVATEEDALYPYKYINYAAFWQDPPKSCGTAAVSTMKEVSQKYDPNSLFRKQAAGFKLG